MKYDFSLKRNIAAAIGQIRFAVLAATGTEADVRNILIRAAYKGQTHKGDPSQPGMAGYRRGKYENV